MFFPHVITEKQLAGQISGRTSGFCLEMTVPAASVFHFLMFRILAYAVMIFTADTVLFIVFINKFTCPVINEPGSFSVILDIKGGLKVL